MRVALGRPLALGMLLGASGTLHAAGFHAGLNARGELIVSDQPATGLIAFDPYARRMSHPADRGPRARTEPLDSLLERAAAESGVDRALLHAVVQQESAFNPQAVSPAGAVGLMQLMPATARRFGVRDRFDPAQNLRGGAAYLAWLLTHFNHDLDLALAAYNAGEGSVHRHGNRVPPFAETQAYVQAVKQRYAQ
ncbi:lytic transglycosylase domain-containing protein [Stenotrophomonas lacuserhaii]|uniref:lytic transglycosylase domain-containing protein n=1 Tax=Stenotrophomonas lacuserhaii TaxID=2760084 RepID=UPI001C73AC26